MATINFNDIVESSYIDDEGQQVLKLVTYEDIVSSVQGLPGHRYQCERADGARIKLDFYYTNNIGLIKYKQLLKALKFTETQLQAINIETLPEQIIGKKFLATIKRQKPRETLDVTTGDKIIEESRYFEIVKTEQC